MSNVRIKLLMPDIGGVVAPFESSRFGEALMPFVVASKDDRAPKSPSEITAFIFATEDGRKIRCKFEQGEMTREEYFDAMRSFLRIKHITPDEFWPIHNASMMWIDGAVVDLLHRVRQNSRTNIMAVTDTDVSRMLYIAETLRSEYSFTFDHVVPSYSMKVMKCKKEFWEKALNEAEQHLQIRIFSPQDCLVVDDNPENVAFLKRLGFHTHQFRNAQQLREVFDQCGLLQERRPSTAHP
jgi:FMN phosphatase YigB (HAD superfamily)